MHWQPPEVEYHAPGHLRDALLELALPNQGYAADWYDEQTADFWARATYAERVRWLAPQLQECTDILSGWLSDELELKERGVPYRTYGALASLLLTNLDN